MHPHLMSQIEDGSKPEIGVTHLCAYLHARCVAEWTLQINTFEEHDETVTIVWATKEFGLNQSKIKNI